MSLEGKEMTSLIQQSEGTAVYKSNMKSLYIIGGISAILQLVAILSYAVVMGVLGPKPASPEEYFAIFQVSQLEAFLRGDFLLLILIGLYLGTFPALYVALKRLNPIYTAIATLFTVIAVTGTFASESTFSMLHLGKQYMIATEAQRIQLLAAGEAIIASDMWNGTAAYMGGILLQGSGVMISVIMLRSKDFRKVTAYAGLLANGFDLIQHIIHPFAPSASAFVSMFMGLFYFVWFPMLAWDLFRQSRSSSIEKVVL
jgi:hypothetical protein